ncbi:MAG TPA: hypothetical protein VGG74_30665 [Kofleriaceae bacterium]|jgi:hypothetical protein
MLRGILAVLWLVGCAVDAPVLAVDHPANPTAPSGRRAPPSEAFGSGSAQPPPMTMPMQMHHS